MADENTAPELDDEGNPIVSEGAKETPKPAEEPPAEGGEPVEDTEIEEDKIPVRSSAAHVIARQKKTIEKLRSKSEDEDPIIEDDDDLSPEASKAMDKRINQKMDPIMDAVTGRVDEDELQTLFTSDPEARKYEKRIRSYMRHSAYKSVPPRSIYYQLAFENASKTGSDKRGVADTEAGNLKGGGSSRRPSGTSPGKIPTVEEIDNMDEEEFEKLQQDVQRNKFAEN